MSSDAEKVRRVRELFDQVIEHEPGARSQFLNVLGMYDSPEIRRVVEELLAIQQETEELPGLPVASGPVEVVRGLIGQRLGAYSVVRHIGNGGMGAVYEAVRADDESHQRVAIKLLHRGLDSRLTLERFNREGQILANLKHPNIAALLDGGMTTDGRSFLVMEYVDGIPINRWCDERIASIQTRLALFSTVCAAVQHAHRDHVLHRNLKPGNILVTGDGTVKLLDFGLLRLVEGEGEGSTPITQGRAGPFTPAYVSPEQLRGERLTTASDVYALGVVLFELLSGKRPYSARSASNIDRSIADHAVPTPSAVATPEAAVRCGEKSVARLRARFRGDLDAITTMSLRRDPARRYQSAEELRADISRYFSGRPVRARAGSPGYRTRKLVRRHALGVELFVAALAALAAGIALTSSDARHTSAEKVKAERSLSAVAVMARTGNALLAQGNVDSAEATLSQALTLGRSLAPSPDTLLASIIGGLGNVARSRGQPKESERLHREALDILRRVPGPRDDKVALSMNSLAVALGEQNKWADAESLHRDAIAIFKLNHRGLNTLTADAENSLATALDIQGNAAAAESTYLSVLEMRRHLLGAQHPDYALTLFNYSTFLSHQGRCDESVTHIREVLALRGISIPESDSSIAASLQTLGLCLDKLRKHGEAGKALQESLDLRRKYLGDESWLVASSEGVLGEHFALIKQYNRAEALLLGAERMLTKTLGADNPRTRANARRLAALYDSLGEKAMADSYRAKAGAPPAR